MSGHEINTYGPGDPDLFCETCGGVRGSTLPTQCPGRPLTLTEEDEIADGRLDYREGAWTSKSVHATGGGR
jgi:hypothetical protein